MEWLIRRVKEKLKYSLKQNIPIVFDAEEVCSALLSYFFPNPEEFLRYFSNPQEEKLGEILKEVRRELERIEVTFNLIEEIRNYNIQKKRKVEREFVTRIHHTYTKETPLEIFDWKERKEKSCIKIESRKEKKEDEKEGLGAPLAELKIVKTEGKNTFDNLKAWEKYWRETSEEYKTLPSWIASYHILESLAKEMKLDGKNLLEVGCGKYSAVLEMIKDKGISSHIIATDSSKIACSEASKNYDAEFVVCVHPYSILWRKEFFDFIFCNLTLHNFHRQAKGATLLTLDYGLKPGGKIVVIESQSRRKDLREIKQFLESMGYRIEERKKGVRFEGAKEKRLYVLIAEKIESKDFPIEKWIAKSYLKDNRIGDAIELAEKFNLKIKDLFQEIKREDKIDVENPLPPPYVPPSFEQIKERTIEKILESFDSPVKEIIAVVRNKVKEVFYDKFKYIEPAEELIISGLVKGCLDYESCLEIMKKYNLGKKDWSSLYWRIWRMSSTCPIHLPSKKGEKLELTLKHVCAILNEPFDEVIKRVSVYRLKDWQIVKQRLYEETNKLARKEYERALSEYNEKIREWEESQKLRI